MERFTVSDPRIPTKAERVKLQEAGCESLDCPYYYHVPGLLRALEMTEKALRARVEWGHWTGCNGLTYREDDCDCDYLEVSKALTLLDSEGRHV